jgi:hypothetical protein
MFRKLALLVFCAAALLYGWWGCSRNRNTITTESTRPDGRRRLVLIDTPGFDRNFVIRLDDIHGDSINSQTLFTSADEGRPIGTERFIWSNSGRYAILVGQHFFVGDQFRVATGERLYLWIDAASGIVLGCNSDQSSNQSVHYKPFHLSNIKQSGDSWPEDPALK